MNKVFYFLALTVLLLGSATPAYACDEGEEACDSAETQEPVQPTQGESIEELVQADEAELDCSPQRTGPRRSPQNEMRCRVIQDLQEKQRAAKSKQDQKNYEDDEHNDGW